MLFWSEVVVVGGGFACTVLERGTIRKINTKNTTTTIATTITTHTNKPSNKQIICQILQSFPRLLFVNHLLFCSQKYFSLSKLLSEGGEGRGKEKEGVRGGKRGEKGRGRDLECCVGCLEFDSDFENFL